MRFTKKMGNLKGERTFIRFLRSTCREISIGMIGEHLIRFTLNTSYG